MKLSRTHRATFAVLSLAIMLFGIGAIFQNPVLGYHNSWGLIVFGPFAILVGALFFVVTVLKPDKVGQVSRKRKHRR